MAGCRHGSPWKERGLLASTSVWFSSSEGNLTRRVPSTSGSTGKELRTLLTHRAGRGGYPALTGMSALGGWLAVKSDGNWPSDTLGHRMPSFKKSIYCVPTCWTHDVGDAYYGKENSKSKKGASGIGVGFGCCNVKKGAQRRASL